MSGSANRSSRRGGSRTLRARYAGGTTHLRIGRNLNEQLAEVLRAYPAPRLLVSESQVARARQRQLEDLQDRVEHGRLVLRAGEEGKSSVSLLAILAELHELQAERGSVLVAFGGGMVGDLGGLAASLWKRGMPLVLAPSSLLAMVDACVGGKTAINFGGTRNSVGTFWPADHVVVDLDCLETLPQHEWLSGFGELLKTAWLSSPAWAEELEAEGSALFRHDHHRLDHHVEQALRYKIQLTQRDEKEQGERALLNLGHTLAHVLEAREEVELPHGQAVLLGMLAALLVARQVGEAEPGDATEMEKRLIGLLKGVKLLPRPDLAALPSQELVEAMAQDKKVRHGRLRMVLPRRVGDCVVREIEAAQVLKGLQAWKERLS